MILEKNIYINENDFIIQKMLSTDWFEITKKQYTNMIFENVDFSNHDEITLLDIGSHLGLWTIRIAQQSRILGLKFKGYLYEPSSNNVKCLKKNIYTFLGDCDIKIYNNIVHDQNTYMNPVEIFNEGSFDIFYCGEFVRSKIPGHDLKGIKIIILPCMSTDFEILKLLEKTYLQEDVLIVSQLIERNLAKNNHTREEVITFLKQKKFNVKKYDFDFSHLDPHLEHTYFIFSK
jgi:hypothetical protein